MPGVAIERGHQTVLVSDDCVYAGPVTGAIDGGCVEVGVRTGLEALALDAIGPPDFGVETGFLSEALDDAAPLEVHIGAAQLVFCVQVSILDAGNGVGLLVEEHVPVEGALCLHYPLQVVSGGVKVVAIGSHHARAAQQSSARSLVAIEAGTFCWTVVGIQDTCIGFVVIEMIDVIFVCVGGVAAISEQVVRLLLVLLKNGLPYCLVVEFSLLISLWVILLVA
ncbi:unnamed protein product [Pseudo-nitzschia multistriata]|uniref:Uncharacterized protein n=1 Tax=Pseudo-nitzschia multistriata TaxID=183589 RepID=A0A448ZT23_9STRA|nr:unnamed protein product [Pseudo-nitzschia multistriata]